MIQLARLGEPSRKMGHAAEDAPDNLAAQLVGSRGHSSVDVAMDSGPFISC